MSVAGKWNLTIKSPTGAQKTAVDLKEAGGKITGRQTGDGTDVEIASVTYDGNTLVWITHATKPMKMKLQFTATVDGSQMSGKVKAGFLGSYPFTATRE